MKLKKIASLALAGIMAVSMLAGCKDGGNSNSGSSSENTGTATGYSAMFGEKVSDKIKDMDYVTFQDNSADQTALKNALGTLTNADITSAGWNAKVADHIASNDAIAGAAIDAFKKNADIDVYYDGNAPFFAANTHLNGTYKVGVVYVIDGSVNLSDAMKQIADQLNTNLYLEDSLRENETNLTGSMKYDYSYVVSASVVNVPNTQNLQVNFSTNVIAITITRTGVDA